MKGLEKMSECTSSVFLKKQRAEQCINRTQPVLLNLELLLFYFFLHKCTNLPEVLGIVFLLTSWHPVIPGKAGCTVVKVKAQRNGQPCHCTNIFLQMFTLKPVPFNYSKVLFFFSNSRAASGGSVNCWIMLGFDKTPRTLNGHDVKERFLFMNE